MRDPPMCGFFGAREHAISAPQRWHTLAALGLALLERQARGRSSILRIPIVGNADRFTIFDIDHASHGNLRHTAHAVIGGLPSVAQPLVSTDIGRELFRDSVCL